MKKNTTKLMNSQFDRFFPLPNEETLAEMPYQLHIFQNVFTVNTTGIAFATARSKLEAMNQIAKNYFQKITADPNKEYFDNIIEKYNVIQYDNDWKAKSGKSYHEWAIDAPNFELALCNPVEYKIQSMVWNAELKLLVPQTPVQQIHQMLTECPHFVLPLDKTQAVFLGGYGY